MADASERGRKLLGLLGLARRAGKLTMGFTAVDALVKHGERPLVVVASDIGPGQRRRVERWEPLRGLVIDEVTGEQMAAALGREKLVVVGTTDPGFIKGIGKLE